MICRFHTAPPRRRDLSVLLKVARSPNPDGDACQQEQPTEREERGEARFYEVDRLCLPPHDVNQGHRRDGRTGLAPFPPNPFEP